MAQKPRSWHAEGIWEFNFGTTNVARLDRQNVPLPKGMRLVDFAVERDDDILLFEVKDPSGPKVPEAERARFAARFRDIVDANLVPKARDSYCYLHLMKNDAKPMSFIAVIGSDSLPDRSFLGPMQDRLGEKLRQESDRPWERRYVRVGIIVPLDRLSKCIPRIRHRRTGGAA